MNKTSNKLGNTGAMLIAVSIVLFVTTGIMALVQAIGFVGFSHLLTLARWGVWIDAFENNPAYSHIVLVTGIVAVVLWFSGWIAMNFAEQR